MVSYVWDFIDTYDTVNTFLRSKRWEPGVPVITELGISCWYSEFCVVDTSQSCLSHWETGFHKRRWSGEIHRGPRVHTAVKTRRAYLVTRPNGLVAILSLSRMLPAAILFAQSFVHSAHWSLYGTRLSSPVRSHWTLIWKMVGPTSHGSFWHLPQRVMPRLLP